MKDRPPDNVCSSICRDVPDSVLRLEGGREVYEAADECASMWNNLCCELEESNQALEFRKFTGRLLAPSSQEAAEIGELIWGHASFHDSGVNLETEELEACARPDSLRVLKLETELSAKSHHPVDGCSGEGERCRGRKNR